MNTSFIVIDPTSILNAFISVALSFAMLPGVAFLVVSLTNMLKIVLSWFGLSINHNSDRVAAWLSLFAFCALVYFQVFRPDMSLLFLDDRAAAVAQALVIITGFLTQLMLQRPVHTATTDKLPLINASYTTAAPDSTLRAADMARVEREVSKVYNPKSGKGKAGSSGVAIRFTNEGPVSFSGGDGGSGAGKNSGEDQTEPKDMD